MPAPDFRSGSFLALRLVATLPRVVLLTAVICFIQRVDEFKNAQWTNASAAVALSISQRNAMLAAGSGDAAAAAAAAARVPSQIEDAQMRLGLFSPRFFCVRI